MATENTNKRPEIYINTRVEWRQWLGDFHQSKQSVWVICNTKKSGLPFVDWSELVEEGAAVGDHVGRWEGVGEDTGGAGAIDVGTVGASDAAGGGAAVIGDSAEAGGDSGARGGLEELLELGG